MKTVFDRKVINMLEPRQRTAIDGKTWWVVFDVDKQKYSTLLCFGKYKTKRACRIAIEYAMAHGLI